MSRRAIVMLAVFLGVLLVGNIIVLSIWLPNRKNNAPKLQSSSLTPVAAQSAAAPAATNNSAGAAPVGATSVPAAEASSDFALERQVTSASGNLQIKQFRDRKTKVRRIMVEDAHRPGASTVLCESKRTAWVVVSPDDQWIAVNQRNESTGGGVRLYHRSSDSPVHYTAAEGNGPNVPGLQDSVWKTYLTATRADPNTPRQGVTIDATGWENDSRKLDISVAYLPSASSPDVPEPWSCTYNITSKQVEPLPDQPAADKAVADADAVDQRGDKSEVDDGAVADGGTDTDAETVEDDAYPGEKFPATRLDELTVPDVNESSLSEITYAINEMFARHGAEFKDKKVTKQFAQFSWYKPRPGLTFDDAESEFSDVEKQNLKVLGRCRDAKLAAGRRKSRPVRGQAVQEESTAEKVMRGIRTWQDLGGPMPPHP